MLSFTQLTGSEIKSTSLHLQLDLINYLWDLRQKRRAQDKASHMSIQPTVCIREGDNVDPWPHVHPPFRASEGDDLLVQSQRLSLDDPDTDADLVYQYYDRNYINQVEALLTSLYALLFQIIDRLRHRQTCNTNQADDDLQRNVAEVKLCWAVCESLQGLTYRSTETLEGWMIYEFRRDTEAGLKLEKAYTPDGITTWEPNPWGGISRPSQPLQLNTLAEHACASKDEGAATPEQLQPALQIPEGSNDGSSNPAEAQDHGEGVAIHVAVTTPQSTSTTPHSADPAPRPTWASLLSVRQAVAMARSVTSEQPSCASTARSALDDGAVSVSGSDAGFATACDCNCPALDPRDLEDLHHIRLRILLRTAAIKHGWHTGHNMSLRDFVREEMSPTSFGKTEKRKKLFMDYRNAMLNPQNNIKDRGDMAAHEGTVMQIKRAVEWRTMEGKHQFLKDLFRAVTGKELGQVAEDCDQVLVA